MMGVLLRMRGLLVKEITQIARDPSSLMIAFLLPVVLLLVNGFGVSLDATAVRLAVVIDTPSAPTNELFQAMAASPYLAPMQVASTEAATKMIEAGTARGMLVLRDDVAARLMAPSRWPARIGLVVNGADPNTARIVEGYVAGAIQSWLSGQSRERRLMNVPAVSLEHRYWFNAALRSSASIIPGMVAYVMSMTGTLLTALVVAREWERGTMESLLASPARMAELVAAKLMVFFVLGMASMAEAMLMAMLVFAVPFYGGLAPLLVASALFLLGALALGLFISTLVRNQFLASQIAFLLTMLPAMLLSGMLFDIASMPYWLQMLTYAFPARYLVSILQTLFLAGTVWEVLLPNLAALAVAATITILATLAITRRRLD